MTSQLRAEVNPDDPSDPVLFLDHGGYGWYIPACPSCGRHCCRVGIQKRLDDHQRSQRMAGVWEDPVRWSSFVHDELPTEPPEGVTGQRLTVPSFELKGLKVDLDFDMKKWY